MWLFSEIGFFSAVENVSEQDHVLVRGRLEYDMLNLKDFIFEKEDLDLPVLYTLESDYHYRMNIPKDIWGRVCKRLAEGIAYHNFMDYVEGDPVRDDAYTRTRSWLSIKRVQKK